MAKFLGNRIQKRENIRGTRLHTVNGFPVNPFLHVQNGLWLLTRHSAFVPQTLMHGFTHFWLMQALSRSHSDETTHSGRQVGALPTKPGKQEQMATPLFSLHWLFGPHGLHLSHGFSSHSSFTFTAILVDKSWFILLFFFVTHIKARFENENVFLYQRSRIKRIKDEIQKLITFFRVSWV